jgi:hypothetical protein
MTIDIATCGKCHRVHAAKFSKCPHCGFRPKKPLGAGEQGPIRIRHVVMAVVGLPAVGLVVLGIALSLTPDDPKKNASDTAIEVLPPSYHEPEPTAQASNWTYSEDIDAMRGTSTHFAITTSGATLDLPFPDNGGSTVQLILRSRPKDGLSAIMQVSKGQILCNTLAGGHLTVKFDDKPVREFLCGEPSDGSNDTLFVLSQNAFVKALLRSQSVTIEAEFYQAGTKQISFNTAGLIWPCKAAVDGKCVVLKTDGARK